MTTLSLSSVFIAPVSNLTTPLIIGQNAESEGYGKPVEIRNYSGGRRRTISRPGQYRELTLSFPYVTRANYDTLLGMVGLTVLLRDQYSRRIYGVISDVSGRDWSVRNRMEDVTFTITEIDIDESV